MWFVRDRPRYDYVSLKVACFRNARSTVESLLQASECTYTASTCEHSQGELYVFTARFRTSRDRSTFLQRLRCLWYLGVAVVKNGTVLEWAEEDEEEEEEAEQNETPNCTLGVKEDVQNEASSCTHGVKELDPETLLQQWRTEDLAEIPYDPSYE